MQSIINKIFILTKNGQKKIKLNDWKIYITGRFPLNFRLYVYHPHHHNKLFISPPLTDKRKSFCFSKKKSSLFIINLFSSKNKFKKKDVLSNNKRTLKIISVNLKKQKMKAYRDFLDLDLYKYRNTIIIYFS